MAEPPARRAAGRSRKRRPRRAAGSEHRRGAGGGGGPAHFPRLVRPAPFRSARQKWRASRAPPVGVVQSLGRAGSASPSAVAVGGALKGNEGSGGGGGPRPVGGKLLRLLVPPGALWAEWKPASPRKCGCLPRALANLDEGVGPSQVSPLPASSGGCGLQGSPGRSLRSSSARQGPPTPPHPRGAPGAARRWGLVVAVGSPPRVVRGEGARVVGPAPLQCERISRPSPQPRAKSRGAKYPGSVLGWWEFEGC